MKNLIPFIFLILSGMNVCAQSEKPMAQYPSPMKENIRPHLGIPEKQYDGYSFQIDSLFHKPVYVYVPLKVSRAASSDLLIHFFSSKNVTAYTAEHYNGRLIAVTINLGSGSSVFAHPFADTLLFNKLLDSVKAVVFRNLHHSIIFHSVIISGFSAGYGAVREILRIKANVDKIDGVLLLDGLHASYVPERKTLADGGKIDPKGYTPFLNFCALAAKKDSKKKFLFTHSEIFPGTFVSTTESAEYILKELNIKAFPALKTTPMGMQQISEARKNHFEIVGFAGNSGPDHIDHQQGLSYFLNRLRKL